jgi:hypothetical protein
MNTALPLSLWEGARMPTAEYHALIQKAEEYERKAQEETDLFTKKALEAVAREYRQRAEQTKQDQ